MKTKLRIIQEKKKKITNEVTERDTQDRGWIKTKKWHKNLYFERLERNWFKKKEKIPINVQLDSLKINWTLVII